LTQALLIFCHPERSRRTPLQFDPLTASKGILTALTDVPILVYGPKMSPETYSKRGTHVSRITPVLRSTVSLS